MAILTLAAALAAAGCKDRDDAPPAAPPVAAPDDDLGPGCRRDGHHFALEPKDGRVDLTSVELATGKKTSWTAIPGESFRAAGCVLLDDRMVFVGEQPSGAAAITIDAATGAMISRTALE